jgi:radical SAM protein with 4Fe4S-binding SPASM domain
MPWLVDCSFFPAVVKAGVPLRVLEQMDATGCMGGNAYAAVDVQGRLKPCSFWPETMGMASEVSAREWANSAALNRFREVGTSSGCADCEGFHLCRGACRLLDSCF